MRIFMAAILLTLFVAFGLRAEAPDPADAREYVTLTTLDLINLNEGRAIDSADPAGLSVELLFVPTRAVKSDDVTQLRDEVTGLTCTPAKEAVSRVGQPGDDFLVVRGVMGRADARGLRQIANCRVVGWDGVVWEEQRALEAEKQDALRRAGRL